jgi:cell division ATPase FtsA
MPRVCVCPGRAEEVKLKHGYALLEDIEKMNFQHSRVWLRTSLKINRRELVNIIEARAEEI